MMLGFLLARAGIDVVVLEKHADFLRDFRGDTIHPSTMQVMDELGLLDEFLKLPHEKVRTLTARFGDTEVLMADFSHLPVRAPFIAMMPQWDFLNFLAAHAKTFPTFRLLMSTEATGLLTDPDRVVGIRARVANGGGEIEVRAPLTVAADGRTSTLRQASGLKVEDFGAPMDVLWFRLPREPSDTDQTQARFDAGRIFIMLNRGDYWQCAFVILKGRNEQIRATGLDAFREALRPILFDPRRADAITSWDQIKLLTVQVNRLTKWWKPGLLCIGDAAHAMSPIGGVGVNLAIQDAVAAANILAEPLRTGRVGTEHLAAVQRRREWPTRVTQHLQLLIQKRVIAPTLAKTGKIKPPLVFRLMTRFPIFSRLTARVIGLGVRPEHVAVPQRRG